jgi:hypothetical protein
MKKKLKKFCLARCQNQSNMVVEDGMFENTEEASIAFNKTHNLQLDKNGYQKLGEITWVVCEYYSIHH